MRSHTYITGLILALLLQGGLARAATVGDEHGEVSDALLDTQRGGADTLLTDANANLTGTVGSNQAYNLTTGGNIVTAGSFAGANGLSTVIQNTGNNVLIQNSTIINLQLQ